MEFLKKIKSKAIQYWQDPFFEGDLKEWLPTTKPILTAILSSVAVLFQSAGGFAPGIGFFVSALTTLPIFIATIVSVKHGFLSYFVTILLLLFIQPSELIIFPFTTGILGLALGVSFYTSKSRCLVVSLSGTALFMGILAILFILRFPVLGPGVGTAFHYLLLLLVALFSILYAWIAAAACSFVLKRLTHILPTKQINSISDQQELNHLEDSSPKKENVEWRK